MSKAFDRINISRLQDTCKRIGIPPQSVNFITELHTQRQAQIITAFGLTSPVHIRSGIEQGETYSPLLWKIYYDPILSFIYDKYQNSFLKIQTQSPLETISQQQTIPITIPPLAYMDDTTWHTENLQTMQEILNDTNNLYKLNNIEINPTKSDLLHIYPKSKKQQPNQQLQYNNQTIKPRKQTEVIRYLGIFFDGQGLSQPTYEAIFNKIENFLSLTRYKKLTPTQISKLFNLILQLSLEYLLQIVTLHPSQQTKLSRLLTIYTKKSLSLAKNTNNTLLTNSLSFNLPTLTNIVQKVCASNIDRLFNNNSLLKAISLLRIKDWLYKIWQPQLTSKLLTYHSRKVTNYNLIFQLSQLAKNNITLANINSLLSSSSSLPSLQSNIYNILPSNINLATTNSLRNNKLLFVEQIMTADNLHLLP